MDEGPLRRRRRALDLEAELGSVSEYDYDIRSIYLEATPEDLAVFNRTHPDVLEHASRDTAYEDRVCEAG